MSSPLPDYNIAVVTRTFGLLEARTAADAPIAAEVLIVNTPGNTASDLFMFPYHHRRCPLYPFEPNASYECTST